MNTEPTTAPGTDPAAMLADIRARILRHYPTADTAYVGFLEDESGALVLWSIDGDGGMLWPDEAGEAFVNEAAGRPDERLWLDARDGDPVAELKEINRMVAAVYAAVGPALFGAPNHGAGWWLPLTGGAR